MIFIKNLADFGMPKKPSYKEVPCKLCEGTGYTKEQYKPRMVQDGWEKL